MTATVKPQPVDLAREPAFALGPVQIRPATREVLLGEAREILEPKVMQVLVVLHRGLGEVVSREELIARCWAGRAIGDDAINRCIGRLRRLSETHGGFRLETVPKVGYRLLPCEDAGQVAPHPSAPAVQPAPAPHRTHWPYLAAGASVLLILGLVLAVFLPSRPVHVAVTPPPRLSIAVLPFTPLNSDPEMTNLGEAIASAVTDQLSNGTRFVIVSPVQSFAFRGAGKAKAAKALHADFLIDGDVRRTPGWYTVSVRLIDGSDGTTIRSVTLNRPSPQMLPDLVATRVAAFGWIAASGFSRNAKWDAHVMAGHLRLTDKLANGDPAAAYEISRRMAADMPGDAFAQHEHGVVISYLLYAMPPAQRPALLAEMRAAEDRAIHLDGEYGDPYIVLQSGTPTAEWAKREALLRRCLAMAPESLYGRWAMVRFLHNSGRFREAAPMIEEALARAPYQDGFVNRAINSRVWLGRAAEAKTLIVRSKELFLGDGESFAALFEATAFNGDLKEGERLLSESTAQHVFYPEALPAVYGQAIAALRKRRPGDVAAFSKACEGAAERTGDIKQTCLIGLSALGRLDEAFALAERLYPDLGGTAPAEREARWLSARYFSAAFLFIPATAPLRADPRFMGLAERLGLLGYWKTTGRAPDFCAREKAPVCAAIAFARR